MFAITSFGLAPARVRAADPLPRDLAGPADTDPTGEWLPSAELNFLAFPGELARIGTQVGLGAGAGTPWIYEAWSWLSLSTQRKVPVTAVVLFHPPSPSIGRLLFSQARNSLAGGISDDEELRETLLQPEPRFGCGIAFSPGRILHAGLLYSRAETSRETLTSDQQGSGGYAYSDWTTMRQNTSLDTISFGLSAAGEGATTTADLGVHILSLAFDNSIQRDTSEQTPGFSYATTSFHERKSLPATVVEIALRVTTIPREGWLAWATLDHADGRLPDRYSAADLDQALGGLPHSRRLEILTGREMTRSVLQAATRVRLSGALEGTGGIALAHYKTQQSAATSPEAQPGATWVASAGSEAYVVPVTVGMTIHTGERFGWRLAVVKSVATRIESTSSWGYSNSYGTYRVAGSQSTTGAAPFSIALGWAFHTSLVAFDVLARFDQPDFPLAEFLGNTSAVTLRVGALYRFTTLGAAPPRSAPGDAVPVAVSDTAKSAVFDLPDAGAMAEAEHEAAAAEWRQRVASHPSDVQVLSAAAAFFEPREISYAIALTERARQAEPTNPAWSRSLGRLYLLRTGSKNGRDVQVAHEAFAEAVRLSPRRSERFLLLAPFAWSAWRAGHAEEVQSLAEELLRTAETHRKGRNYGDAVHAANTVLGLLALQSGDVPGAKARLAASGKAPRTPRLASSGPNMTLAQALLERREIESVIAFLDDCRVFWALGVDNGILGEWKGAIRDGRTPDFGIHLRDEQ